MVIVAAILLIFIPIVLLQYAKATEANQSIADNQAQLAVSRLANTITAVGNLGEGSSAILEIFVPPDAESVEFRTVGNGGEVVMKFRNGQEIAEITKFQLSPFRYDSSGSGIIRFSIVSKGTTVEIKKA